MLTRVIFISFFSLTAAAADPAPRELKIAISAFPSSVMPMFSGMQVGMFVAGFFLRMVTQDTASGESVCELCEQLPSLQNGLSRLEETPEGKRIRSTFRLNQKYTWNNGDPVTADDVIFSWRVGTDMRVPVSDRWYTRDFFDMRKIDEWTFEVVTPVTPDYQALSLYVLNSKLDGPVYQDNPAKYHENSLYLKDPYRLGLYLGPYQPTLIKHGDRIELAPNPNWKGAPLAFSKVTLLAIGDSNTLMANLLGKKVDFAVSVAAITTEQIKNLGKMLPDHKLVSAPIPSYDRLSFNLRNPVMKDAKLRQALLLSVDRETILKNLLSGRYQAANSPMSRLGAPPFAKNLEEARKLFKESGWNLVNGKLINAQNQPLQLRLVTNNDNAQRVEIVQAIQHMWGNMGVEVSVRTYVAKTLFDNIVPRGEYDVELSGRYTGGAMSGVLDMFFHSDHAPVSGASGGPNKGAYKNAQMDQVLKEFLHELDPSKYQEFIQRFLAIYREDPPEIPLTYHADDYIAAKWLEFRPSTSSTPISHWIEDWKVLNR